MSQGKQLTGEGKPARDRRSRIAKGRVSIAPYHDDYRDIMNEVQRTHRKPSEIGRVLLYEALAERRRKDRLRARGIDPERADPIEDEIRTTSRLLEEIQALRQELRETARPVAPTTPVYDPLGTPSAGGGKPSSQETLLAEIKSLVDGQFAGLQETLSQMVELAAGQGAETRDLKARLALMFKTVSVASQYAQETLQQFLYSNLNRALMNADGAPYEGDGEEGSKREFFEAIIAAVDARAAQELRVFTGATAKAQSRQA